MENASPVGVALLRRLWVTDVSVGEPDGLRLVVDAVPESATCGDLLPTLDGVAVGVAKVPPACARRRRDPLLALRHRPSADGCRDKLAVCIDPLAESPSEGRVGMDLCCGLPLPKELRHGRVALDRSCTDEGPGERLDEESAVRIRQKRDPREDIVDGTVQRCRTVHCEVAQQPCERLKGLGPVIVAVGLAQVQRRRVPTPEQHVMLGQLSHDIFGPTQELRERSLDNSHTVRKSELPQKSMGLAALDGDFEYLQTRARRAMGADG